MPKPAQFVHPFQQNDLRQTQTQGHSYYTCTSTQRHPRLHSIARVKTATTTITIYFLMTRRLPGKPQLASSPHPSSLPVLKSIS